MINDRNNSNFCSISGLVKGLNQVGKALDRKDAFVCILAEDCDDPVYKKTISALAKQNKIPLIEVDSRTELGEWLGQCKYDKEGNARKTRGCSSVAIKDWGEMSEAHTYLEKHIKEHDL
jgi:small subunit ribosomal protein S12e